MLGACIHWVITGGTRENFYGLLPISNSKRWLHSKCNCRMMRKKYPLNHIMKCSWIRSCYIASLLPAVKWPRALSFIRQRQIEKFHKIPILRCEFIWSAINWKWTRQIFLPHSGIRREDFFSHSRHPRRFLNFYFHCFVSQVEFAWKKENSSRRQFSFPSFFRFSSVEKHTEKRRTNNA